MINRAVRAVVRSLARFVARRPRLVALAARAMTAVPPLKRHLRRLITSPVAVPTPREQDLLPREAGVLADLRDAVAGRGPGAGPP